ncbi:HAD superfamily hydrolase (TIGR01459 family) [Mesorhizobium sp. J18]|uniref:TIGR01459 family HAD-type hydrolase n=1 Tax=Mesorhizobium sp. J18 TaxID=935263 RepID=UPI00119AB837|nr:TIGR01459 family HAD-type hydrolase [Mesorhizobium sp. J18]TWG97458.1 HAD superfamily hydrolase (TIGR01459 family) [Mesorhizobium sp. J18]
MQQTPVMIDTLDVLTDRYSVILCDVWGVMHNGLHSYREAAAALIRAREQGKAVVLITNAPRPHGPVQEQLRMLDVPDEAWDRVVTSGDVTRDLISNGPRRVFHLGPERDVTIYDGIDVELVEEFEASSVVCTGLFDDRTETPEDYAEMLQRLRMRDLPFICANPDIVVERGDVLIWCAGALARDYGQLGGRTMIAGKPHRPIYDAALKAAGEVLGREVGPKDALAIGDGMLTDVKGAAGMGIDVLYVTAGIHSREYGEPDAPDPALLTAFLERHGYEVAAAIPRLR